MLFCFGLGYCALRYLLFSRPAAVCGTVRPGTEPPPVAGVRAIAFDPANMELRDALAQAKRVLVSIPPDGDGDPVLRHFAEALPRDAGILYLSSLGVYGDAGGATVSEDSPCRPQFPRSIARLAAERAWAEAAERAGARLAILRLAGIYGPGRNALTSLRRGEARRIARPGQLFNRIHVDDIAQAIDAAFVRDAGGTFNVADDAPSPPGDPIVHAAELLGVAPPPEIPFDEARATMSPMARSFYEECRRADNTKLKTALGVRLMYPTYREGLRALFEAGEGR
jgi:nucleoside-diphosphate-sugar epimerase